MSVVIAKRARHQAGSHSISATTPETGAPRGRAPSGALTTVARAASRPHARRSTYLVVLHGMREGAVFELTVGVNSIGRGRRANVHLEDEGISRLHAQVIRDVDGTVKIVDLDSTNGTYVNGRRVDAESLRDGDRIRIGPMTVLGLSHVHPAAGSGPLRQAPRSARTPIAREPPDPPEVEVVLRTLRVQERALGPDHIELVEVLESLGLALLERQCSRDAEQFLGRALRILEQHPRASLVTAGRVHHGLGRCALSRGQPAIAVAHLERAQLLLTTHDPDSALLPETWFLLACALQAAGVNPRRRQMLARRALDACEGDPALRRLRGRIHRWLERHAAAE